MSQSGGATNSTSGQSVSYVLLNAEGEESRTGGGAAKEILSPIPFAEEDPRAFFDDDLTQPSHNLHDLLLDESSAAGEAGYRLLRRPRRAEISGLNYLNAFTYAIHVVVWWGVAVYGLHGLVPTQWEETEAYETLVTPATFSGHYLWIPILIAEAAFSIAQLFPHYRARPVVAGMSYRFFYAVLLQIAYTFLYSFGVFYGSFVVAVMTLLTLLSLLTVQQQHARPSERGSVTEYCLFRLPFLLHTGWILLMTVEHCALLLRRYSSVPSVQLAGDIFSLGILLAAAVVALSYVSDFVIPSVILWVYIGIACRLNNPSSAMVDLYGSQVINAVLMATYFFIGSLGSCLVPSMVVYMIREFCTITVVELH